MGTGSTSLLRPLSGTRGRVALLAFLILLAAAGTVRAATPSPDPSPAPAITPDPAPTAVVPVTHPVTTPAAKPAPTHHRARPRAQAQPKPRVVVDRPFRDPDHPPPRVVAVAEAAVHATRVSRALALTVALLVLLSAAFVAGAAREVAR